MNQRIRSLVRRQDFFPGWLGVFLNPFYIARASLRDAMVLHSKGLTGKLLDVGCGSKPYRELFSVDSYIGLEIDSESSRSAGVSDFFYDGDNFPFTDEEFDSILCNQVLEHVFDPTEFLGEIARVLKPGGQLLLTVPFVWDEHEQPYDYARYSSFGLRALFEAQGFVIVEHNKTCANASIIFQLINAYLFKVCSNFPRPLKFALTGSVLSLFTLMGLLFGRILPDNPDLFLDHVVLAEKSV